MARPLDICIHGSGVVAHALALLLARPRLKVGLVAASAEAAAAAAARGPDARAYALNQRSRELLLGLRAWPDSPEAVTPVLDMFVQEPGAGRVHFQARREARDATEALAWIVDVPALEQQLAAAVRFHPQIELLSEPAPARLVALCDGQSGSASALHGVEIQRMPYEQWAVAMRVACARAHEQAACQWFRARDILGFLPLGGPSGHTAAIVWSVDEDLRRELQAADDATFAERLHEATEDRFGALELTAPRALWPLQLATARRWCGTHEGQSWVLAGDAAHTVHPLAGQGLNLGLADAEELASQIHARAYWREVDDIKLLRAYERVRKADVALMGWVTDGLQQLFAREGPRWSGLRAWGMRGFELSGPIKHWVMHQAMGTPGRPSESMGDAPSR
jgi:2-polyprenyl-6-methoxyphenol hydroxylase-like FAD-dependent oxidoreductase